MADHNEDEVKLFGSWGSPFSSRVEIALKMKGVKYELIEENIASKSPLLLKYNPVHKKILVLLHNGKPIAESIVIIEYINETWESGTPILPEDPHERAVARFWAKYLDDKMVLMWKAFRSTGVEQEQATKDTEEALETLENELKGKKFFGGETIGLADSTANFLGLWLGVLEEVCGIKLLTQEKYPRIHGWINKYVEFESTMMKNSLATTALIYYQLSQNHSISTCHGFVSINFNSFVEGLNLKRNCWLRSSDRIPGASQGKNSGFRRKKPYKLKCGLRSASIRFPLVCQMFPIRNSRL